MRKNKILGIGLVLAAVLLVAVVLYLPSRQSDNSDQAAIDSSASTSLQQTQPADPALPVLIIGDPAAKVTIVEYGDFQCPFCKQFYEQTEPQLLDSYVNNGNAKIEFHVETHIGEESIRAGEAAYCANDQTAFKNYHDELFKRQKGENRGAFSDNNLKRIASDIKLNQQAFDSCLDNKKYRQTVENSQSDAKRKGVSITPTIFIGDRKISGAQPFSIYKTLIDAQL